VKRVLKELEVLKGQLVNREYRVKLGLVENRVKLEQLDLVENRVKRVPKAQKVRLVEEHSALLKVSSIIQTGL
jgi:hypothetical protein